MSNLRVLFSTFAFITLLSNAKSQNINVTSTTGSITSGSYSTLKQAFDAINNGNHQGVITISVVNNTNEGTTPAVLNSGDALPASYTSVAINAGANVVSISGSPASGFGVIELNGADNVVINGDNPSTVGTARNLTINNNTTSTNTNNSVIRIATSLAVNSANNLSIKNLVLNGNVTNGNDSTIINTTTQSNLSYGIYVGGGAGTNAISLPSAITVTDFSQSALSGTTVNNLTIENNQIDRCGRGIMINSSNASVVNNLVITNNTIGNPALFTAPYRINPATTVYVKGILVSGANSMVITKNTVKNIISFVGTSIAGIELGSNNGSGTIRIDSNTINTIISNTNTGGTSGNISNGISVNSVNGQYSVTRNDVSNIETYGNFLSATGVEINANGAAGIVASNKIYQIYGRNQCSAFGITLRNAGNAMQIQNNFIYNIQNNPTIFNVARIVAGINIASGINHKIYHNSIHLYGSATVNSPNIVTCLITRSAAYSGLDIRNNIFSNERTTVNSASVHSCLFMTYTPAQAATILTNMTLNNNAYYTGSTTGVHGIGYFGTTYVSTNLFSAINFKADSTTPSSNWRNYSSAIGNINNDNASLATTENAPFISDIDLHINAVTTPMESGGTDLNVTNDIDNENRNANTPDIGADEFNTTPCSSSSSTTNISILSSQLPYVWNGLTFNNSGSQIATLSNSIGCDSLATLNLTVDYTACLPSYLPTNGLIGYWPFCGNAIDESGNGNNGTLNGPILTTDRFGIADKAYNFDGINDFISVADNQILRPQKITISLWAYFNELSPFDTVQQLIYKANLNNASNELYSINSRIGFAIKSNSNCAAGTGWKEAVYGNNLSRNNWHNIVCTFDGNTLSIYLNGILLKQQVWVGNIDNCIGGILAFGRSWDGAPHFFNGKLDDISLWNRALSSNEIQNLYNASAPQTPCTVSISQNDTTICSGSTLTLNATSTNNVSSSALPSNLQNGLVGYWPFNGNANDESGNGNNGTVNGATLTTDRFGNDNKAFIFDSNGDVIDLPEISSSLGSANSNASYSIWFLGQASTNNNSVGVLLMASSSPYDYQIRFEVFRSVGGLNGIGPKVYYRCPSENDEPTFVNNYNTANWHNIIVSINGTTGQYNYYFDGVLIPEMSFSFNGSNNYYNANRKWQIGSLFPNPFIPSHQFYGKIDDIAIWNRALTTSEIKQIYGTNTYLWSTGDTTASINVSPTQTTTYYVTVNNGTSSCTDSVTITVNNCNNECLPSYLPTNGLVGYWPFCGNANDESGNGNNGTVNGATLTTDRFGVAGKAYGFDGVDDYIDGSSNGSLNMDTSFSISCWIKSNMNQNQGRLFTFGNNNNITDFQYALFASFSNNSLRSYFIGYGAQTNFEPQGPNLSNSSIGGNVWKKIDVTFGSSTLNFYIDGILDKSVQINDRFLQGTFNSFLMGKRTDNSEYFNGSLDDIAIYNRALSAQEIAALYAASAPQTPCNSIINQNDTTICSGESLSLTALNNNGVSLFSNPIDSVNFITTSNQTKTFQTNIGDSYCLKAKGEYTTGTYFCNLSRDVAFIKPGYYGFTSPSPLNLSCSPGEFYSTLICDNRISRPSPDGYNINHEYYYYFSANSTSFDIGFYDNLLGDNCGNVNFVLYKLPAYLWSTGDTTASINVSPTQTTTYYVTVNNGTSSCTDSVTVTVNSGNFFLQDTIRHCGASYSLSAGVGYNGYLWSTGSTTSTITATTSKWYVCTVTQNGCTSTDSVYVQITNPASIPVPASITIQSIQTNVCGSRRYRYIAPALPSNATGYQWSFVGSLFNESGVIDSGSLTSRIITVTYSSNSACGVGDSIKLRYNTICGYGNWRALKLSNTALLPPNAPASITVQSVDQNNCSARRYRYIAPLLPAATATNAAATGWQWELTGSLAEFATIDSGDENSRIIVVVFSVNGAAQSGDSIKLYYQSDCGLSKARALKLSNHRLTAPMAPSSITIHSIQTNVCGHRKYRFIAPMLPGASSCTGAATGWQWTMPTGPLGESAVLDSGTLNGRVIVIRFNSNAAAAIGDSIRVRYLSNCGYSLYRAIKLTNTALNPPLAPASITIQPVATNVCGFRKYRYIAPAMPAATTANGAATGWQWVMPTGTLGATATLDSGSLTGNVIVISYSSNAASGAGDTIRLRFNSGCGYGAYRAIKLSNTLLNPPLAPASITMTLVHNDCGARIYRYTAPALPAATTVNGAATGYAWTMPFGPLGSQGTLDSGTITSRTIRIMYPSNDASQAGDSIRVRYNSACGFGPNKTMKLSNTAKTGCPPVTKPTIPYSRTTENQPKTQKLSVLLYPNPSADQFYVRLSSESQSKVMIRIFDMQGKRVQQMEVLPNGVRQIGNGLKPGTYLMQIRQDGEVQTKRLVKL